MLKKIVIMTSFFLFFQLSAMKNNLTSDTVKNAIYYLTHIPLDIQNFIAQFLMETEEEFIERTRQEKYSAQYYDELLSHIRCFVLYNNKIKEIKINKIYREVETNKIHKERVFEVIIIDTCNAETKLIYKDRPESFALSEKVEFAAALCAGDYRYYCIIPYYSRVPHCTNEEIKADTIIYEEHKEYIRAQNGYYEVKALCLSNFKINKTKEFPTKISESQGIAFNKQGTHIIVHGNKYTKKDGVLIKEKEYQIFPLTTKERNAMPKNADKENINLLHYYLREKGVCKVIANG